MILKMKTVLFALALSLVGVSLSLPRIQMPEAVKAVFRAKPEVHVASTDIGHGFDPLSREDDYYAIRSVLDPDGKPIPPEAWKQALAHGYHLIPVAPEEWELSSAPERY
jgi:hypothetical protein